MKIFTLVKSSFAVCVLLFSLNVLAARTPVMEVSDYDSPEQFCSAVSKNVLSYASHIAKYCGYFKNSDGSYSEFVLNFHKRPKIETLNGVCSRDTVSYRLESGKPLPSEKECLRVLELAFKLSSNWEKVRVQKEALASLSLIYDSIPDSEKESWKDTYWNRALDIVEPSSSKESNTSNPGSWARWFHHDLRERTLLREENARVGYVMFMGLKDLKAGVNPIKTYGTCTASIRYVDTQILRDIKESGKDYWRVKSWETEKQGIEKSCKEILLAGSS